MISTLHQGAQVAAAECDNMLHGSPSHASRTNARRPCAGDTAGLCKSHMRALNNKFAAIAALNPWNFYLVRSARSQWYLVVNFDATVLKSTHTIHEFTACIGTFITTILRFLPPQPALLVIVISHRFCLVIVSCHFSCWAMTRNGHMSNTLSITQSVTVFHSSRELQFFAESHACML